MVALGSMVTGFFVILVTLRPGRALTPTFLAVTTVDGAVTVVVGTVSMMVVGGKTLASLEGDSRCGG